MGMHKRLLVVVVTVLVALTAGSAWASTDDGSSGGQGSGKQPAARSVDERGGPRTGQCEDGQDNDGDGLTDAADPACQQPGCEPSSQTPRKCLESDLDPEGTEAGNCEDGEDNDGDGLTDADDPDCQTGGDDEDCDNGIDDDRDGAIDHADDDCTTAENPDAGNCEDGFDNDNDGLTDADDPDCADDGPGADNLCTGAAEDPGLLTDDTLGQTLYDGGLSALAPLTEDPERNGALSGPLGEALTGTPIEVVGDEASCAVDLLLDEETLPDL